MTRLSGRISIRRSFKSELFAGLLVVAMIPVIISSALLMNMFKSRLESDYQKEAICQVVEVSNLFDSYLRNIDETLVRIMTDSRITGNLYTDDSWEKNQAYTNLYSVTEGIRNVAGFSVYDKDGQQAFTTESDGGVLSMPTYWGLLKVAYTHPEKMIIKRFVLPDNKQILLQTARAIFVEDECIGFVVSDIRATDIETILYKAYDESNGLSILDSFYEEVFSTKTGVETSLAKLVRQRSFDGEHLKKPEDNVELFVRRIGDTELTVVLGKSPILTEDIRKTMWGVIIIIGILSMFLCLIVASAFSGFLTAPLKRMKLAMEKVRGGDLNTKINSTRQDELGELSKQFDNMTEELKNYMDMQVKQQQELNDSNIAMMQAQLNPHFLYNTLDTMKWVAKANQVPQIAKMSADLAQILRMSISEKKFISVKDEMELVDKYVEIQQIRFGGNFTYDAELPIELEDCIIPKLIVQPIVENAVIHGLKEQERGHIFVNVFEENDCLCFEISDNGCGIDKEVIDRINSRDRENFRGHIGFYNVDTIIKLYYGEAYGIKAKRLDEGGTMISIMLPINKGEGSL